MADRSLQTQRVITSAIGFSTISDSFEDSRVVGGFDVHSKKGFVVITTMYVTRPKI